MGDGYVAKMISIDIEAGQCGARYLVMRCPCGHEQGPRTDQVARLAGSMLRMVNHARNCAESRDSEPISRETAQDSIEPR